jgi:hypothetical protein
VDRLSRKIVRDSVKNTGHKNDWSAAPLPR